MAGEKRRIGPLWKQLFVVTGVSLNMANIGAVMGFPAILLPQLSHPDSDIPVDVTSGSWIASIVGISLFVGNIMVPTLMGRFGRKPASLVSCLLILACWIWLVLATDVTSLLIARFIQGLAIGINLSLSPIMIGELTSPANRGIFSAIMTSSITAETLLVHILGSYETWRTTALVCAFFCCASFGILIFSPESPSWLADQGRYEDSTKAYRWLRGDVEDSELEKMLEARRTKAVIVNSASYEKGLGDFIAKTLEKKEFYKPVFIMVHLYALSLWTGMAFLIVYTVDIIRIVVGLTSESDLAMHITILDIQRLISTILGLILVKKIKRRTILFSTLGINLAALIILAAYTFAKTQFTLPFDHPAIGLVLIHIHMFSITTGALPLPIIISGELFPLEFRSLAGGISGVAFSLNYFVTSKTAMVLISAIGIYGAYSLYAVVTIYCMVVIWVTLPETKDRTLQDIEEEFRGEPKVRTNEETDISVPLKSEKEFDNDV